MDKPLPDDFDPYRGYMTAISGGNGDGSKVWLQAVIAILQGVVVAGILGLFASISDTKSAVAELRATINEREKQNDREIDRIDSTLSRHDQRITDLERGEGARQSDANNRQKRQ